MPRLVIPPHVAVGGVGINQLHAVCDSSVSRAACGVCGDVVSHWRTKMNKRIRTHDTEVYEKSRRLNESRDDDLECDGPSSDEFSDPGCNEDDTESVDRHSERQTSEALNRTMNLDSRKVTASSHGDSHSSENQDKALKAPRRVPRCVDSVVSSLMREYLEEKNDERPHDDASSKTRRAKWGGHRPLRSQSGGDKGLLHGQTLGDDMSQYAEQSKNTAASASEASDALEHRIAILEAKLESSKQETIAARQELDMVVRKGDRRFQEEMRLRKEWNVKLSSWEAERIRLLAEARLSHENADRLKNECIQLFSGMSTLTARLRSVVSTFSDTTDVIAATSTSFNSQILTNASPGHTRRLSANLFCVVCQSHSAEMVFSECGHMCLCFEHYSQMNDAEADRGGLKICPLCKTYNNSIVRVKGLY